MNRQMKASGIEWLGEIPAHWEIAPVNRYYSVQLGKMLQNSPGAPGDSEIPYLKSQHVQWFQVKTIDAPTMWASRDDLDKYQVVPGDLLVCEGGEGGRCGILNHIEGVYIIQNALHRVRARKGGCNSFLQYVLSSVAASNWFDVLNDKATIAHFTNEKFKALLIPIPPLPQQRAIADFLDAETERIDALVDKNQRLVKLLKERRQAIITQAVTKGLDNGVVMKDSWQYIPIRRLFRIVNGGTPTSDTRNWDGDVAWATPIDLSQTNGKRIESTMRTLSRQGLLSGSRSVPAGSLILSTRAPIGYVSETTTDMAFNQGCRGLVPVIDLDIRYFRYQMIASTQHLDALGNGSTFTELSGDSLASFKIFAPPLPEQRAIADRLDAETARIDTLVSKLQRQLELLTERRQAVITAAVTGKLQIST